MKKYFIALALFLTLPLFAWGITVPWERPSVGLQHPIFSSDAIVIGDTATSSDGIFEVNGTSTFEGVVDLLEVSEPSGLTNIARFFAFDQNGETRLRFIDNDGVVSDVHQDNNFTVRNTSGVAMSKGDVVYVTDQTGRVPEIGLAKSDATSTLPAIGILNEDVSDNSYATAIKVGIVENIDTSAFSLGDTLYVSATTAGEFTNTRPPHPHLNQPVGKVLVVGAGNGSIKVDVEFTQGDELGTRESTFGIGDGIAGDKMIDFDADSDGSIVWDGAGFDITGYIDVGVFADGLEPTASTGRFFYSSEEDVLSFYDGDGVEINIGQDLIRRAKNVEGTQIDKGEVVYVSGSSGSNPEVQLAQANTLATARPLGVMSKDTVDNGVAKVIRDGKIVGIDTSAFTAGDTVYLSPTTPGALTNTQPSSPNKAFRIGTIIRSSATEGELSVDVDRELNTFAQGSIPFAASDGDLIEDNANLFWDDTNNRLGIGESSPLADLHITKDQAALTELRIDNSDVSGSMALNLYDGSNHRGEVNYDTAAALLNLGTHIPTGQISLSTADDAEAVRIDDSGNVGIGNSLPASKLDVTGTTTALAFAVGGDTIEDFTGNGLSVAANVLAVDISVFDTDDLSEGAGNLYYTNERAEDAAGGMFSGNTETLITATYQDADGTVDLVVDNNLANYDNTTSGFFDASSDVDHDATTNFVANEHIDHSTVSISAGTGLTGGGDITTSRTLDVSGLTTSETASGAKTGIDTQFVTGTAGTGGNCAEWDGNGDLVDAGAACGTGSGGGSSVFATTSISGAETIYPIATTSDFLLGSNATSTASFWYDDSSGSGVFKMVGDAAIESGSGAQITDTDSVSDAGINIKTAGGLPIADFKSDESGFDGSETFLYDSVAILGDLTSDSLIVDTNVLVAEEAGNVGIGTTGPDSPLDVLASSGEQLRLTHTDGSVYNTLMTDSSANLVLNSSASNGRFYVRGNGTGVISTIVNHNTNTGTSAGSGFLFASGADNGWTGGVAGKRIDAASNSRLAFRILSDGSLSAADDTAPFYIEGNASGGLSVFNTDVDVKGELDTATNGSLTSEERIISTTIASTSPEFVSGGSLPAIMDKDGFELTEYTCFVEGGTSVVVNLSDGTNDTETITCTTSGASDADVATNDTFTADELGYIEIGTITGDVNYLHFEAYANVTR